MYVVMVGPVVDLSLHPSHRVEIIDLETHSCQSDTKCSAVQPCMDSVGSLCCVDACGEDCDGYDCALVAPVTINLDQQPGVTVSLQQDLSPAPGGVGTICGCDCNGQAGNSSTPSMECSGCDICGTTDGTWVGSSHTFIDMSHSPDEWQTSPNTDFADYSIGARLRNSARL